LSLIGTGPALAANECSPGTNVTCTSAGNFYVTGIEYTNANQTVSLSSGVVVNAGANLAVHLGGSGTQTLNIAPGVTISNTGSNDGIDIDGATSIALNGAGSSVSTTGNFAWGLGLVSAGAMDVTLGSVSSSGNGSIGVFAQAGGPIDITTGSITMLGSNQVFSVNAIGATATGAGANGAVTIDTSGGTVSLTGATTSHALNIASGNVAGGGAISVTTANVSTVSANANAINATTNGTGANGAVTIDTTAGTITTAGAGSRGISATSTAAANSGLVTVNAGNVTTTGTGAAHAIFASSTSGAVTVTAGALSTTGAGALGVSATGRGLVNVTTDDVDTVGANSHGIQATSSLAGAAGLTTIDSTGGTITTLGSGARGVSIESAQGANATVHAGGIDTTGENAAGVHILNNSNGGAITVTSDSIVTRGNTTSMLLFGGADAVQALTNGTGAVGTISIDTSGSDGLGTVETFGAGSYGIRARSAGGAVDVTAGSVVTHADGASGIVAESSGTGADGNVTVTTVGLVSTTGSANSQGTGDAVNATSFGSGEVRVTTADVSTAGGSARGVVAQSSGGAVTVDTTGGTVSTTGAAAFGVIGTFSGTSGPVSITTGDVHTEGNLAIAVGGFSGGPDADLTIDTTAGTITTLGTNGHGINAVTSSFSLPANAGLLDIDAGDISTAGGGANGIFASAKGGAIDIELSGDISTTGDGSDGIMARNQNTATTTIRVNGAITTTGEAAHGVQSDGVGNNVNSIVTVSAAISATGADSRGIVITGNGDEVTINAPGTVTGAVAAVDMQQLGSATVTNAGTVTGTGGLAVRFLGAFASTFDNSGTFNGNVLMGAGNDLVILDTSTVANGSLDGQGDTDTLRLHGTASASIDLADVLNFEFGEKTQAGTWTLTGSNATLAMTFDVQGGALLANTTAAGLDVTVDDGARLGGTGTIGAATIGSGATLAPGNSIGTLSVATATFDANAIFEVEIDPASSDLFSVGGVATIDSAAMVAVIAPAGTYTDGTEYLILDAGTRSGAFGGVIDNSAFLDFTLDQDKDPDQVWLRIAVVATFPDVAETPNQLAAATALEELAAGNPLFDAIVLLDEGDARHAFDLASGEIHASIASVLIEDSRFIREATLDRAHQSFDTAFAERTAFAGPGASAGHGTFHAWGRTFGSWGRIDGDGNAARLERDTGGFLGGVDAAPSEWLRIGIAGGVQRSDMDVAARNSTADINAYHLAAFAAAEWTPIALRAGGAITWHDIDTSRRVAFPGFDERLSASYDAQTKQAFVEAALPMRIAGAALEPFVSFTHLAIDIDGFTEQGGVAALGVAAREEDIDFTTVGLRLADTIDLGGDRLRLSSTVAWRHLLDGDFTPSVVNAFPAGTPFLIAGVPLAQDTLKVDAGVEFYFGDDVKLGLAYSGEFADGLQDHGATATLTVAF